MSQSRIRVLSDQTINKIAAGEVIENPASVVKELVENSLDAGSTSICVEIQAGGRQLIRISDNGSGMSKDDALLSLERHATSKIKEVEDIQDLFTMGFRGEAIPSIAAISKFTLLTSLRSEEGNQETEGTMVVVEGGRLMTCASAHRSPGTTIEVKSLFFNVPVRRKFQKSPSYDVQEIVKMLSLLALGYPTIQFELISDQKSILKNPLSTSNLPFEEVLAKRIESVLGKDYSATLLPLNFQQSPFAVQGFIGMAQAHKPNRTGQYLFINQRAVYSPLIASAVREGYGTMLPTQRFPVFVLHLQVPGSLVDVNVHPQKKEVRLRQEFQLKQMIIQAVQVALRQDQRSSEQVEEISSLVNQDDTVLLPFWSPYASLLSPFPKTTPTFEENWEFRSTPTELSSDANPSATPFSSFPVPLTRETDAPLLQPSLFSEISKPIPRILTTLLGYFMIDPFNLDPRLFGLAAEKREGGLALIDQRAAYSRMHYEQLLKKSSHSESQPLLIPLTLQLSAQESRILCDHLEILNTMGFGLREFSENTFIVDCFPSFLKQYQLQSCISMLIQDLVEMQSSRRLESKKEEQLALIACRASLPTAKRLTNEEAEGLLKQLMTCNQPSHCPMGKPIALYYAPEEINKWF